MTVTPEQLAAYADGELDTSEARLVEAELARSPELRAQLGSHRALKAKLAGHFAGIAERAVPEALVEAVRARSSDGMVVDLARARADRQRGRSLPRWTWLAAPALAASVALVVMTSKPTGDHAAGELAAALDRQLVASQPAGAPVRILLSFRDDRGQYCRAYAGRAAAGIACRDDDGWRLEKQIAGGAGGGSEYRQAGSTNEALMASVQAMAAGPALDAGEELAAQRRGWMGE